MTIAELNNDGTLKLKDGSKATVKRRTTTSPKKVFDDYLHSEFHLINFFVQDGNQSHSFSLFFRMSACEFDTSIRLSQKHENSSQ